MEPFSELEFAISDAAKGIGSAVSRIAAGRAAGPSALALTHGLDIFHATIEVTRVLALHWRRAEAAWTLAEADDAKVSAAKQQGVNARGVAQAARAAWSQAAALFENAQRLESAWDRAHAALGLFTPEGRLNGRATAAAEIAEAMHEPPIPHVSASRFWHGSCSDRFFEF